jgi:uncharacterized membrane protein YukC
MHCLLAGIVAKDYSAQKKKQAVMIKPLRAWHYVIWRTILIGLAIAIVLAICWRPEAVESKPETSNGL